MLEFLVPELAPVRGLGLGLKVFDVNDYPTEDVLRDISHNQ